MIRAIWTFIAVFGVVFLYNCLGIVDTPKEIIEHRWEEIPGFFRDVSHFVPLTIWDKLEISLLIGALAGATCYVATRILYTGHDIYERSHKIERGDQDDES